MADSFGKKEREKRKRQRKKEKEERKKMRQEEGGTSTNEFVFVDEFGNLTTVPPDQRRKKVEIDPETIPVSVPPDSERSDNPFERVGVVKFFNEAKGFGFIVDSETREDYFVHADNLHNPIRDNDRVSFELGKSPRGPVAIEVKLIQ